MRGKHRALCVAPQTVRITPADAGKTLLFCLRSWRRWDHPRGCGENCFGSGGLIIGRGSPPRMRGKPFADAFCEPIYGITPADAGKTKGLRLRAKRREDHPRGCGENLRVRAGSIRPRGSPPRMRGKLCLKMRKLPVRRITPADAGKTLMNLLYTLSK